MKKCQTCGNQNSDEMRFCLNCGASLPDAPVVVNFGGSQGGQSNPGTNPYGQSMETQFGANRPGFQQPGFQPQQQQQQFSMAAQHQRSGGSGGGSKKILIAVGGVALLFLLILGAGAAIIGYNIMKDKPVVNVSPTPTASPSVSPSASPSPSATKSASPTPKPTEKPKSSTDMRAKFDKIWVNYNVSEEGVNGMRIHVKFTVYNMKDVDSKLIVYFQKSDGTDIKNSTPFSTSDGRVAAVRELKPGFDSTEYKDLDVFIPYSALGLPKGTYKLKMDADVALDDETLVQHLGFHEFEFEQF